jgi:N-methylhydantoinase A
LRETSSVLPETIATAPALRDSASRRLRVGIDIGGTFTDFLVADDSAGLVWVGKTLTTQDDPSISVRNGLEHLLNRIGATGADIAAAVHGTTLVTNVILERKGDRTALLTTRGFRDAIEIAREHRYDMYDIFLDLPRPIAPRRLRFEVDERVLANGSVYRPLDPDEVASVAERCAEAGVEAVAVCFLHSYRSPEHERIAAAVLRERLPHARISISSDVAGEIREYERTSTTLVNAYVQRLVVEYLDRIQADLRELGSSARLLVMLSSGATATVDSAKRFPVRLVESGPAAGALAAAYFGTRLGRPNLFSFDMGGTTAKACLIQNGRPRITTDFEVDRVYRFQKGSGLPVKAPAVEMIEIGAGGGSVARLDRFGLIKVGPQSAGASPGPACYGQGGTEPTVTDADLVLGYLDAGYFLGGRMRLDPAVAERAIKERIAGPARLDLIEAAWAIHHVVNENMAGAARIHAIELGCDARAFPLFAFGGAGPVHAFDVGRLLGCSEVIVPRAAGVGSTIGFLVAPPAFDFVRSAYSLLHEVDWDGTGRLFVEMEAEGRAVLVELGVAAEEITLERWADMRLSGQAHLSRVAIPAWREGQRPLEEVEHAFRTTYEGMYKRTPPGVAVEVFNWRLVVFGRRPALRLGGITGAGTGGALKDERPVYWRETGGFQPTRVYDRYRLQPGDFLEGPVIVEEEESTTVVGPRGRLTVDEELNLVIVLGD